MLFRNRVRPFLVRGAFVAAAIGMSVSSAVLDVSCFAQVEDGAEAEVAVTDAEDAQTKVSFNTDIRPILSDKCFHCHGPDAENQESDFRLDSQENAFADLGGYAGVVAGSLADSEVHQRIGLPADDSGVMPPEDAVRQLTDAEKDLIDRWIEQGGEYDAHWAFESLPGSVTVAQTGSKWVRNEIDEFIFESMNKAGMSPNVDAPPEKWLRRVTFDLTGLPPTIADLDAFVDAVGTDAEQAYVDVLDRLMASDACAERLASEWLDVARYSDSYGYQRDDARNVWPYRDWVIAAFRNNKPYDEFVIEQLAGDLLPNPTRDQILATAFNRLHSHKKEGGVAIEEFRVENVSDRAHTFSAAFMALTLECARCHDHKYDPIKTKEYYEISSFFANIDENGLISYFTDTTPTPAMPLPSPEQEDALKKFSDQIKKLEGKAADLVEAREPQFQQWLERRQPGAEISGLIASLSFEKFNAAVSVDQPKDEAGKKLSENEAQRYREMFSNISGADPVATTNRNVFVQGVRGNGMKLSGDDSVVIPDVAHYRRHDAFSFSLWIKPAELKERGVIYRLSRGWDDAGSIGYELTKLGGRLSAKLVNFWPGNALCVETDEILEVDKWHHVAVTYDGSSTAAGLKIFVDSHNVGTRVVHDSLTRQINQWINGHNDFAIGSRFRDRGFKDGVVDELRGYDRQLSALEVRQLFDGRSLTDALAAEAGQLNSEATPLLRGYYWLAVDSAMKANRTKLRLARQGWNEVMDATPGISIMREQSVPRKAYLLQRGSYEDHGEEVFADTPDFLPPFPADQPRTRLGLAKWLLAADHPLTARVVVNRYWQLLFGQGIVRTPEDFGLQGQTPTHALLLDWLALDFRNRGWDIRRLIKQIALSSTYRQSSVVAAEVREKDPENRLYARGPGQRLSAEMVRDNVLAISGLLVDKVGGPPVKPYDLALAYTPLKVDAGSDLYRRSLYTFWKRTSPAPVMITMNANKREVCRMRREITSSPLQALVLLNGRQFVEASKVLAARLIQKHARDEAAIADEAFRLLTSRSPTDAELEVLQMLLNEQLEHFGENGEAAKELLEVGETAADETLAADELAAATVLVNTIMNLDEAVRNK